MKVKRVVFIIFMAIFITILATAWYSAGYNAGRVSGLKEFKEYLELRKSELEAELGGSEDELNKRDKR